MGFRLLQNSMTLKNLERWWKVIHSRGRRSARVNDLLVLLFSSLFAFVFFSSIIIKAAPRLDLAIPRSVVQTYIGGYLHQNYTLQLEKENTITCIALYTVDWLLSIVNCFTFLYKLLDHIDVMRPCRFYSDISSFLPKTNIRHCGMSINAYGVYIF